MKHAFLSGATIYLRPLSEEDAAGPYVNWLNDAAVCRYNSHHVFPYNRKKALDFIENALLGKDAIVLAVCRNEDGMHIGNASLQKIDLVSRSADFAILLGDTNSWGRGIGKEAGTLLLRHGFLELNLHRISCGTSAENTGMQKLALSLGMKQEGTRRDALYKHGRYIDILEYGILAEEFILPSESL